MKGVKLLEQLEKMIGDLYGPNTGYLEDQRKGYDHKDSLETNCGGSWDTDQGMSTIFHKHFGATAVWGPHIE